MVVKLQLHDLASTGGVVGRLSGISTAGALVGTFVTGFVLVATTPTRTIIDIIGVGARRARRRARRSGCRAATPRSWCVIVVLAAGGFTLGARRQRRAVPGRERVLLHARRARSVPGQRPHPLARRPPPQLRRPRRSRPILEFDYARSFADAVDTAFPDGPAARRAPRRWRRVHLPALPRGDPARHPEHRARDRSRGARPRARRARAAHVAARLQVRIGDARLGIRDEADDSRDLVVGDAFGSLSVPVAPHDPRVHRARSTACCVPAASTCRT